MDLIATLNDTTRQVITNFSSLSNEQLNWKADVSKWSIAQCLDHLIVSNSTYFSTFDKLINKTYHLPLAQKLNPFKKVFGPIMVKHLGPQAKQKLKNPKIFTPSTSTIPSSIVEEFSQHQQTLLNYFYQLDQLNKDKVVITSPVSSFVSYSLHHAMQIITVHEQRHFNQAMNVLSHPNYPE
jgi:hypothetical protein